MGNATEEFIAKLWSSSRNDDEIEKAAETNLDGAIFNLCEDIECLKEHIATLQKQLEEKQAMIDKLDVDGDWSMSQYWKREYLDAREQLKAQVMPEMMTYDMFKAFNAAIGATEHNCIISADDLYEGYKAIRTTLSDNKS